MTRVLGPKPKHLNNSNERLQGRSECESVVSPRELVKGSPRILGRAMLEGRMEMVDRICQEHQQEALLFSAINLGGS